MQRLRLLGYGLPRAGKRTKPLSCSTHGLDQALGRFACWGQKERAERGLPQVLRLLCEQCHHAYGHHGGAPTGIPRESPVNSSATRARRPSASPRYLVGSSPRAAHLGVYLCAPKPTLAHLKCAAMVSGGSCQEVRRGKALDSTGFGSRSTKATSVAAQGGVRSVGGTLYIPVSLASQPAHRARPPSRVQSILREPRLRL